MDAESKDESDLAEAYQGRYRGDDVNLRRISNEAKAKRGEYAGFGTYLRRVNDEANAKRSNRIKPFPKSIIAASMASLAVTSIGLFLYFGKAKKYSRTRDNSI